MKCRKERSNIIPMILTKINKIIDVEFSTYTEDCRNL